MLTCTHTHSGPTIAKDVIRQMTATSGVAVGNVLKNDMIGMAIIGAPKPNVAWHNPPIKAMKAMIIGVGNCSIKYLSLLGYSNFQNSSFVKYKIINMIISSIRCHAHRVYNYFSVKSVGIVQMDWYE